MTDHRSLGRSTRFWFPVLLFLASAGPGVAAGDATPDRYAPLVAGVLSAWKSFDVVCLGEDHGRIHDSDLRIALVRHPDFPKTVRVIVVELANPIHQDLLDRFILDGVEMTRDELSPIWRDADGAEVWELPIYEQFLRTVHEVNRALPRERRVRVIGGDSKVDWASIRTVEQLVPLLKAGLTNRGGNIRKIIAEEILDKKLKALAIYGGGHCVKVGMGFPGELAERYPGRIWSVSGFEREAGAREGKRLFALGDRPAYLPITGTPWASRPATGLLGYDSSPLGDLADAIVYYGDTSDPVSAGDAKALRAQYGAELERRERLLDEARKQLRRP